MPTNKKRITSYVGDQEYSAFEDFCDQWECSQSKGIDLLIRHFLLSGTPSDTLSNIPNNTPSDTNLDEAIANHPKLKEIEKTLNELKDSFDDIYHRLYKQSEDNNVFSSLMTKKAENEYLDSEASENNSSENPLEGGSKEIQVSEVIDETKTLKTAKTVDKSESEPSEVSEKPTNTGIEDNGGEDRIETAKQKKPGKLKLSNEKIKEAIANKDFKKLSQLDMTHKRKALNVVADDPTHSTWLKDQLEPLNLEGSTLKDKIRKIKENQANPVIKAYCET